MVRDNSTTAYLVVREALAAPAAEGTRLAFTVENLIEHNRVEGKQ